MNSHEPLYWIASEPQLCVPIAETLSGAFCRRIGAAQDSRELNAYNFSYK